MILQSVINAVSARGVTAADTAAMLVSVNKGTAAKLMVPTSPLGIELDFHGEFFFVCFFFVSFFVLFWLNNLLINHASESAKKKQNKTKPTPVMQNIIFSLTLNDILLVVDQCHLEYMNDEASLLF